MARRTRKKRKSNFTWINKKLISSEAFRSLKAISIMVYFDFLLRRQFKRMAPRQGRKKEFMIINNGEILYPYREAEKKGITRQRFARAITELVEKGFIDISHLGGGFDGDPSKYGISDRWEKYGTDEFEVKTRPKDTRSSRGFAVVHANRNLNQRNHVLIRRRLIKSKNQKQV